MEDTISSAQTQQEQRTTTTPKKARSQRLPYFMLFLLAELWLLMRLLPNDPMVVQRIQTLGQARRQAQGEMQRRQLMRNDPRLGIRAPNIPLSQAVVASDSTRRFLGADRPSAEQPKILIFIGACSPCVLNDLKQWERLQPQWQDVKILLVGRSTPKQITDFVKSTQLTLPIIPDPQGRLAKAYNAVWVPRAYVIDRQGKITWIQKEGHLDLETVMRQASAQARGDNQ